MGAASAVGATNVVGLGNLGATNNTLTVNAGGALDLNNFDQTVGNFTGTGGQIVNTTSGTKTLTIGNGNTGVGTFAGIFATGTGQVTLNKVGTGTITLSGSSTSTGGTTVSNGTLALDFTTATTAAPVLASGGVLTLGGGTLDIRNGTAQVQTVASTTLTGGLSNVTQSSGSSILRMNVITPGVGVVNFGEDSIASTTNANNGGGILGAWATVGGTDWAVNSGSVENGSNNYIVALTAGGYTDIDVRGVSTIADGSTTNVRLDGDGTSGNIDLGAATTTVNTLLQNNASFAGTVDTVGKALVANGIMIGSGKEALTIGVAVGDGSLTTATVGNLALINNNASRTLTVNAPILVNSTSGLSTAGNVLLNGVNTFTGNTGIGNGTLEIGGAGQLGGGSYSNDILIGTDGTLKYNSSANQTFSGNLTGAGGLVKDGISNLTLTGNPNSYAGGTIVNGGKLILNTPTDSQANQGALTINSAGTVEVSGGNPLYNGTALNRTITINGGTLSRTSGGGGNQDYRVKSIDMTAGLISSTSVGYMEFFNDAYGSSVPVNTHASASEAVISANWAARNNVGTTTFVFTTEVGTTASGVDLLFSGNLAGNTVYNVTKAGAGVMAISANYHTTTVYGTGTFAGYSGITTISGGTLQLGNGGATGTLNPLSTIVNNGTLAFNRDATTNLVQGTHFNSVISGNGAVLQKGSGTTVLNGNNTYTGTTTIANGTLSASNIVVSAGASNLGNAASAVVLGDATNKGTLSYTGNSATFTRSFSVDAGGGQIDTTTSGQTLTIATGGIATIAANTSLTIAGAGDTTITAAVVLGAASGALTKDGAGLLNINSGAQTYKTLTTTAGAGTTNVNVALTATGNTDVVANGNLKFGSVSQTLSSLTIGAGSFVTFSGGAASGSLTSGGEAKAPSFSGGGSVVPEPGTIGLLLVGAIGVLNRRRRSGAGEI